MAREGEEEVMQGVYFTRAKKPSAGPPGTILDGEGSNSSKYEVILLMEKIAHLEICIKSVIASNEALREELTRSPGDTDFLEAIEENETIYLPQHRKEITALKERLAVLAPHAAADEAFQIHPEEDRGGLQQEEDTMTTTTAVGLTANEAPPSQPGLYL